MKEEEIKKIIEIDRMLLRENTNLKIICKHLEDRIDKAIRKLNSAIDHYDDTQKDWALKCAIRILKGEEILGGKDQVGNKEE